MGGSGVCQTIQGNSQSAKGHPMEGTPGSQPRTRCIAGDRTCGCREVALGEWTCRQISAQRGTKVNYHAGQTNTPPYPNTTLIHGREEKWSSLRKELDEWTTEMLHVFLKKMIQKSVGGAFVVRPTIMLAVAGETYQCRFLML